MDLAALEIFRTVVEAGGITRAATRLHRVQSNVTTRIRQLEQSLGVELFLRDGKRMVLTPAGQTLFDYARRILQLSDEARHPVQPRGGACDATGLHHGAENLEFGEVHDRLPS